MNTVIERNETTKVTNQVRPDYLAFVIHPSDVKEFATFPEIDHEWRKYCIQPSYRDHVLTKQRFINDVVNPKTRLWCPFEDVEIEEEFDNFVGNFDFNPANFNGDSRAARNALAVQVENFNRLLLEARFEMLKRWLSSEFDLHVGTLRGFGRYLYTDSAPLYSNDGKSRAEMGFVYLGGNNGTYYIQINGTGCKHVFQGTSCHHLYKWFKHLDILKLNRLDLACDDFDGIFSVNSALTAYKDDAFYRGKGRKPGWNLSTGCHGSGKTKIEMFSVGSRSSLVYWRIYNKAVEQGLVDDIWNRSEVELKEVPIEVLLDISGIFSGLCAYAAQMEAVPPKPINPASRNDIRVAIHSFESDVAWIRKQYSKTIARIVHQLGHDFEALISTLVREEDLKNQQLLFDTPLPYQQIISEKFRNRPTPF